MGRRPVAASPLLWNPSWGLERRQICQTHEQIQSENTKAVLRILHTFRFALHVAPGAIHLADSAAPHYLIRYTCVYIWQCPINTAMSAFLWKTNQNMSCGARPRHIAETSICVGCLGGPCFLFKNNLLKPIKLGLSIFRDPSWIRVGPIWKLFENL